MKTRVKYFRPYHGEDIREFSKEVHGSKYHELACEFAQTNNGQVLDSEPKEVPVVDETPKEAEIPVTHNEKKPWCDTCDSKGGKHKKGCPKIAPKIEEPVAEPKV